MSLYPLLACTAMRLWFSIIPSLNRTWMPSPSWSFFHRWSINWDFCSFRPWILPLEPSKMPVLFSCRPWPIKLPMPCWKMVIPSKKLSPQPWSCCRWGRHSWDSVSSLWVDSVLLMPSRIYPCLVSKVQRILSVLLFLLICDESRRLTTVFLFHWVCWLTKTNHCSFILPKRFSCWRISSLYRLFLCPSWSRTMHINSIDYIGWLGASTGRSEHALGHPGVGSGSDLDVVVPKN